MLKPTSNEDLRTLAENAAQLAKIIRDWLPSHGDTERKTHDWRTAENWFKQAADHFTVCERIRNPHKRPFGEPGSSYCGPSSCSAAWFELKSALDEIAVAYGLQGVADDSGCPHLPYEQAVPAVEPGTLRRLENAAAGILDVIRDEPEAAGIQYLTYRTYFGDAPAGRAAETEPAAKATPDFVESDFAELILKSGLAILFDVDRATIRRWIGSGELRVMPGTTDTARKVRIHGDDFPDGLKRPHERKQKLSSSTKRSSRH